MEYGISQLTLIALRSEPNERAEMVTQILFGETYTVIEASGDWLKVCIDADNYEGWIESKQNSKIDRKQYDLIKAQPVHYCCERAGSIYNYSDNTPVPVVLGSIFREMNQTDFSCGSMNFSFQGNRIPGNVGLSRENIVQNAMLFLNSPYLWGGKSPFGIDCSGLTQLVYRLSGVQLLRDASQQAMQGDTITFISEALAGDLLFFDDDEANIIHTGILITENKIIHASGKVRVDLIDHQGIFNEEVKKYTHKLRLIKSHF